LPIKKTEKLTDLKPLMGVLLQEIFTLFAPEQKPFLYEYD
jgi:hypothetical protein